MRSITENAHFCFFAYSKIYVNSGMTIMLEHIDWVLSNFAQQIEREKTTRAIHPSLGVLCRMPVGL